MKKYFISSLLLICLFISFNSFGQKHEISNSIKWLDDANYLETKYTNGIPEIYKVNAKSGKATLYTPNTDQAKAKEVSSQDLCKYNGNNSEFSPNHKLVAFTRNRNLYYVDIESGEEHQLTNDGTNLIYNGWSSWVYMEEILGRSTCHKAYWWSPDSKKIAFLRFDDKDVPEFPLYRANGLHGELELTRYSEVGDHNPAVKLGVIDLETKKIIWLDNNDTEDKYIAFPNWTPNSKKLLFQVLNRDQTDLKIYVADIKTGNKKIIYNEIQKTWVEFFSDIYFLKKDGSFIIRSDKNGWRNLYHYDLNGNLVNQITNVNWRVNNILKVDEKSKTLYFMGTGENSINNHLFSVKLNGKKLKQLSQTPGTHHINISPNSSYFIDDYSNINTPPQTELFTTKGKKLRTLKSDKGINPNFPSGKVEMFTIPNPDGFDMPAYWILPENFDPNKKYGVIFQIYGGPDSKNVINRYINPQGDYMTENGIIRFAVDHRGSGHFGKKGLNQIYRMLGKYDLGDYIEAVKWLRKLKFVDEAKMGISGGSYGGYMAALALTKGADYFTHGWAAYSVIDWRLYDNVYTERYMDTYTDNKEGYDQGNANLFVNKLKGKLWITHGTMDDNVHMQHIMQFIENLQNAGKDFNFMLYPNGRHGWGGKQRMHYEKLKHDFWLDNFGQ
jgi:dipeptidyl-peptidase-4